MVLPRRNEELLFSAPRESRAFVIAVAPKDGGLYRWEGFGDHLITEIALTTGWKTRPTIGNGRPL